MNKFILLTMLAAMTAMSGCDRSTTTVMDHEHPAAATETIRGPHRGRLLSDDHFQIEVTIFETGVPPEYRLYAYVDGKPVSPTAVVAQIELLRFNDRKERFDFTPHEDYLRGDHSVAEPHSFDVVVSAQHDDKQYQWRYPSHEGRTSIAADMAQVAGVEVIAAAPGMLHETVNLYGSIQANAERVRNITARYPGVIRSLNKTLGQRVAAGETLATVESNESLQTYPITTPINGIVMQRHANVGEATDATPLFVIADFGSVWAELSVFPRERARLAVGQSASITAADGQIMASGRIDFIAPSGQDNQSQLARVTLDNRDARWTPGQFVSGAISVAHHDVPLAIPLAALQTFRDWDVVFLNKGESYQAMPLELGRRDAALVEVLSGIEPGERYVSANSYLIKADIEKSAASHDH